MVGATLCTILRVPQSLATVRTTPGLIDVSLGVIKEEELFSLASDGRLTASRASSRVGLATTAVAAMAEKMRILAETIFGQ